MGAPTSKAEPGMHTFYNQRMWKKHEHETEILENLRKIDATH